MSRCPVRPSSPMMAETPPTSFRSWMWSGAGRRDAHDVGRLGAGAVPVVHRDGAAGGLRDGREVQHRVGGAAEGHVEHHAVVDGALVDDLAGGEVLLDQLHDLHAGLLGQADALGVDGGHGAVSGKRDAQGLGEAADGVGGEHAGAGAAGGAGGLLEPGALLSVMVPAVTWPTASKRELRSVWLPSRRARRAWGRRRRASWGCPGAPRR